MLNYITNRIVFASLAIVILVIDLKFNVPIWSYVVLYFVYAAISFYGSYFIQSNFYVKAVCRGGKLKKAVALTFDDGPMTDYTPKVLDILKEHNVPAAFFVIGKNILGNETLLSRINDDGHIIGNHSFEHNFWFSMKRKSKMLSDLKLCDATIEKAIGKKVKFFRPPYGVTNPWIGKVIADGDYKCIGWSLRSYDTGSKSKEGLVKKCTSNLKNGDVILLHDWAPHTLAALPEIIEQIKMQGYEILRLDQLLNESAYA